MTLGTLYIVSTPIGHDDDITLRALKVLNTCDVVVCEEMKEGATLLRKHKLSKQLEEFNEHSDDDRVHEIIAMLKEGKNIALISDCGTPIIADPGLALLQSCLQNAIAIQVVPGVTSIMTALTRSGFRADVFVSAGFLSRKPEERREEIRMLARETRTVVLLETPYRLLTLVTALSERMPDRRAYIGCNLTYPSETHHYGTFAELEEKFRANKFRGEFVIVFEGYVADKSEIAFENERTLKTSRSKKKKDTDDDELLTVDGISLDSTDEDQASDTIELEGDFDEDADFEEIDFDDDDDDTEEESSDEEIENKERSLPRNNERRYDDRRSSVGGGNRRYDDRRGSGGGGGERRYDDRRSSGGGGNRRYDDRRGSGGGGGERRYDDRRGSGGGGERRYDDRRGSGGGGGERRYDDRRSSGGGSRFQNSYDNRRKPNRFNDNNDRGPQQRKPHGNREGANLKENNPYEGMKPFRPRFDRDDREKGRTYNPESRDYPNNPNRAYSKNKKDDKRGGSGGRSSGGYRRRS